MINKQQTATFGVTELDYRLWCSKYRMSRFKKSSKQIFFKDIISGKLVRDDNNRLVYPNKQ